jgi:hypothetical protein
VTDGVGDAVNGGESWGLAAIFRSQNRFAPLAGEIVDRVKGHDARDEGVTPRRAVCDHFLDGRLDDLSHVFVWRHLSAFLSEARARRRDDRG